MATDKVWAVAFKVNVAVTVTSALYFGSTGLHALNERQSFAGYGSKPQDFSGHGDGGGGGGCGILAPTLCVVGVVSLGWLFAWRLLNMIIQCSKEILQVAYCSSAAISGLAAVYALATEHWFGWIVPASLCAWSLHIFLRRQTRILFGSANLKVAALAIKSMPWTLRAALLLSGVQVAWVLLSTVAAVGSMAALQVVTAPDGTVLTASTCHEFGSDDGGGRHTISCVCDGEDRILINSPCGFEAGRGSYWLGCFWLASAAWGAAVLQNLVTAMVTGSVASWWFSPGDQTSVRGALYRATHGSFGSLCKAAAVVSVVRLAVAALRRMSKLGRCGNFLLEWLRDAVHYALTYAICFISIYGLSLSEAGQRVSELFRKRGMITIANDAVVDIGLAGVVLGATLLYSIAAFFVLIAISDTLYGNAYLSPVFGTAIRDVCCSYVLVAVVVATALEVLRSGVKAVFVCFVQDPEALAANHERKIYDELSEAWHAMQAEC
ncbi:unnamed protein product, partial [Hapterophycus canaliculatus]